MKLTKRNKLLIFGSSFLVLSFILASYYTIWHSEPQLIIHGKIFGNLVIGIFLIGEIIFTIGLFYNWIFQNELELENLK